MKNFATIFLLAIIPIMSNGQVINGYAEVTAIAGATLTLGTVDESSDSFEDGEWVVLMQMQDDVIGTTANNSSFGSLGSIQEAGVYEIRQIQSHTESGGVPASVTLENAPTNSYNTGANESVQIITFRELGLPDYTTTAPISALAWDGTIGGVVAIFCPGTFTIAHDIDADLDGFRGAGPNAGGSAGCSGASNYRVVTQANFADKGESIYKATNTSYAAGMGRILNGGGGGNSHNGGGGGGGNYTAGGDGGPGWPTCTPSAGGLGGLSLQTNISVNRIFMGGGGGAGEGNNNLATDGGDGGGIILIKANEIATSCASSATLSVNGESISFAGNDGGGGGGAAGTIVIETNNFSVSPGCPLTIEANGGNGGDVNSGATHGGGGGGAQGAVIFSTATPTTNVTVTTNNGSGGCNNNTVPCTSVAGDASGSDGDGIISLTTGPLPIQLVDHEVVCNEGRVEIKWVTKSELQSDYFKIERSRDNNSWVEVGRVDAAGNSSVKLDYSFIDEVPLPRRTYYRLVEVDLDGNESVEFVEYATLCVDDLILFPNPTEKEVYTRLEESPNLVEVQVFNSLGQKVQPQIRVDVDVMTIDFDGLQAGTYNIQFNRAGKIENHRLVLLP
ncbi:MAG: T9SS type A sorting domain-containing protein [Flavobacteriales bacterium]|nr:T9SS type A sorting domain-containing protein [Flavobacteriales bacterium]